MSDALLNAISTIPAGAYAVAVSGGADSVALLHLLVARMDVAMHVVHLNHETRGGESDSDAEFVRELAQSLNLPVTIASFSQRPVPSGDLSNPSARFRAYRLALFAEVVANCSLRAVVLAHHADDQAETVFHRLLRGSGIGGLTGMKSVTEIGGLTLLRPLLPVRRNQLRTFLETNGFPWREDSSNQSSKYARNRNRQILSRYPQLTDAFLDLGRHADVLETWIASAAPSLPEIFDYRRLQSLPPVLLRHSLHTWLIARGSPAGELTPGALDRLITMITDAAAPPRAHFPGNILVRRRSGQIFVDQQRQS